MATGVFEKDQLKLFVERIERLEEEKKGIGDDIKDVKAEAKAAGFSVPTMMKCIALRKQPREKRDEEESLLDSYKAALGLSFNTTPLGEAAEKQESESPAGKAATALKGKKSPVSNTMSSIPGVEDSGLSPAPEKPKRGRPQKVRDPSDGSLVTIPPSGDASSHSDAALVN
jgi:uncharacterized protein (UPF0335 family)